MLYRVALQWNDEKVFADLSTTENFFVLATDFIGMNLIVDIPKCLSPESYEQLVAAYPYLQPGAGQS